MKKNRGFTHKLLNRFERENRGKGVFEDFGPWHQVRRGEPASIGRSGRYFLNDHDRESHTLSTGEYIAGIMCRILPNFVELREQFPLAIHPAVHEIKAYSDNTYGRFYPGTLEIAKRLNVAHPRIDKGIPWRFSTDVLVTLRIDGQLDLLPVCPTN